MSYLVELYKWLGLEPGQYICLLVILIALGVFRSVWNDTMKGGR
jgi:hypothetical protein